MALGRAARIEGAVQVHAHQRAPGLVAGVLDQLLRIDAGAMHQVVQPTEMLGRRLEHPFAIMRHRHIQRMRVDALAGRVQFGGDVVQAGAVGRHQARRCQADAIARARDGGYLPFK
ncbi:hypothetical protein D3C73_875870 [compost metagenome]